MTEPPRIRNMSGRGGGYYLILFGLLFVAFSPVFYVGSRIDNPWWTMLSYASALGGMMVGAWATRNNDRDKEHRRVQAARGEGPEFVPVAVARGFTYGLDRYEEEVAVGSCLLRTRTVAHPATLRIGDVLATGHIVIGDPKEESGVARVPVKFKQGSVTRRTVLVASAALPVALKGAVE